MATPVMARADERLDSSSSAKSSIAGLGEQPEAAAAAPSAAAIAAGADCCGQCCSTGELLVVQTAAAGASLVECRLWVGVLAR